MAPNKHILYNFLGAAMVIVTIAGGMDDEEAAGRVGWGGRHEKRAVGAP